MLIPTVKDKQDRIVHNFSIKRNVLTIRRFIVLSHRLQRWPNIKPTSIQCIVFTICVCAGGGGGLSALQKQTAVTAYFSSKQLLLFAFDVCQTWPTF